MRRTISAIFVILLFVLACAFAWGRLRPPTPAQAEALHLLQPVPQPTGPNAWATLWLSDYDVPSDQRDAVYVQERARVQAWLAQLHPGDAGAATYASPLGSQFTRYTPLTLDDNKLLCDILIRPSACFGSITDIEPALDNTSYSCSGTHLRTVHDLIA